MHVSPSQAPKHRTAARRLGTMLVATCQSAAPQCTRSGPLARALACRSLQRLHSGAECEESGRARSGVSERHGAAILSLIACVAMARAKICRWACTWACALLACRQPKPPDAAQPQHPEREA